ncbi:MAG: hypothetical protein HYR49_06095 [Gammaproteobacteria bacterium]|nr:hypothetical protein [Gammaproteobacteria bacterium]
METAAPGPQPLPVEQPSETEEIQIAALLQCRFDDGMVYLPKNLPDSLLEIAVRSGFVDADGYLTRRGRALIARYHYA